MILWFCDNIIETEEWNQYLPGHQIQPVGVTDNHYHTVLPDVLNQCFLNKLDFCDYINSTALNFTT